MGTSDIETLNRIAHESPTAVRFFTYLALKGRDAKNGILNLTKLKMRLRKSGEVIDESEFKKAIDALAKNGYGRRLKGGTQMKFNHPVYSIGKAAIEGAPLPRAGQSARPATRQPAKASTRPIIRGYTRVERPQLPDVAAAVAQESPVNKVNRTVVFCFVNGQKLRIEAEGDISSQAVDEIAAALQPKVGSA